MQKTIQKYLKLLVFTLSLSLALNSQAQSTEGSASGGSPTFKLSGDVSLLSHYVRYGLSQSDKDPSLQGSFWFNFGPQFRLGLWGSNVNYANGSEHFNLRINADIKINFGSDSNAIIKYSQAQFYKSDDRNGNILGLHINYAQYMITYEKDSNWEGSDDESTRYGLGMTSEMFGDWKWRNEVGYNAPKVSSATPYFDFRTGLGTKAGVIFFEGAVTATSSPSQFNGAGDVFVILSASTQL